MATKKNASTDKVPADKAPQKTTAERAAFATRPSFNAAAVMMEYGKVFGEQDINALIEALQDANKALRKDDLSACENMLMSQAVALQSMFTSLSRRAINQEYLKNLDVFMRFALKAQNQCRMTLETLANIKNPPVVYARQANIAHGHQQVNNGEPLASHAEKNISSSNELLEAESHEQQRLDTRAPGQAGGADPAVAALEPVNRAKNRGRQAKGKP